MRRRAGRQEVKLGLILDVGANRRRAVLDILDASALLAAGAGVRKLGSEAA
ncbi:hypothetical protein ACQVP2_27745 [Methylobacterium aquaticum]|uniref:hypothetical protein n=1 Tax=Methylobacterium aquaticum TaxID=270351 RepID=UPI003D174A2D